MSNFIGQVVGYSTAAATDENADDGFLEGYKEIFGVFDLMAATDIPAVLRDMERNELTDSQAYQSLRPHEGDTPKLGEIEPTADAIRSAATEAQEIYHYMQLCNGLLIQKQIDSALAKYVDPDG